MTQQRPRIWRLKTIDLDLSQGTRVMGIVNATPDSFSDGGQYVAPQQAIDRAMEMVQAGVAIIDVGGESTRPYSQPISANEEIDRVLPVIEGIHLACQNVPISIDTSKASVARAALAAGAEIINDVTGLEGDPEMLQVAREFQAGVCVMHMQGTPQTMQDNPSYQDVVQEILGYLQSRLQSLEEAGIERSRICLDPGIGFGKTHEHNLTLLAHAATFLQIPCPILIGHSRKGFIGKLLGDKEVERDSGTLAISLGLARMGIEVVRVHAASETVRAFQVIRGFDQHA